MSVGMAPPLPSIEGRGRPLDLEPLEKIDRLNKGSEKSTASGNTPEPRAAQVHSLVCCTYIAHCSS